MSGLPQNWKNWVVQNLLSGVDATTLLNILLQNGFTFEAARKALGSNLPDHVRFHKDAAFYQRLAQPALLHKLDELGAEYLLQDKVQLIRLDGFMSETQCAELAALAKTKLRPSEIAAKEGFEGFRTSSTCDLTYLCHALADEVDEKIIQCLGVGVGENEVIQAQHYAVNQQFKAHTDYFEPGSDEYRRYSKDGGQRTWTFMVYLNQDCEGGETEFVKLGLTFKPTTGTALIWNNLYADGTPNPNTLHQAHPVKKGEKVVITKWFREESR